MVFSMQEGAEVGGALVGGALVGGALVGGALVGVRRIRTGDFLRG